MSEWLLTWKFAICVDWTGSDFDFDLYCSKVESAEPPESAEQRAPANGW